MTCAVCHKEKPPYKCPRCRSPYCSVKCYKEHKVSCDVTTDSKASDRGTESATTDAQLSFTDNENKFETENSQNSELNSKMEEIWKDKRIQELSRYESVTKSLKLIVEINTSPKLSGEQSAEGRHIVALKKIRELRKGGREANAAIEELVTTVSHYFDNEPDNGCN